jgi:hypothetical protein
MKGFPEKFADFPDYIVRITEEIWEGRGLSTLHDYYDPDVIMRAPGGILRGNVAVIHNTMESLAEVPNRNLLAEDVIWSEHPEHGYLSSHRVLSYGRHTGRGRMGEPTGRDFTVRAVADCAARNGVIYDEWLTRDNSGLALQFGIDPVEQARREIEAEGGLAKAHASFHPSRDVAGRYRGRGNDDEWGQRLGEILGRMMAHDFAVIRREYDRAVRVEHPGARSGWSWEFPEANWLALRASFPSARFAVEHQIGREDPHMPPRAAIRWSLLGRHEGWGAFGRPTGAEVYVMGFTHAEFGPKGVRREITVYDEVEIWRQILLHAGAA